MLQRYPHLAQIVISQVTTGSDTGIIGLASSQEFAETYWVKGRFENKSSSDQQYSAKFFAKQDDRLHAIKLDDAKLYFLDRTWDVVRVVPHQTHTEIWLN